MPITFDGNETDSASLERFYRTRGAETTWRQPLHAFLKDPLNRLRIELLLTELESISPASLLDAGCGSGALLELFAAKKTGASLTGCDFNPPPGASDIPAVFAAADIRAMPFRDASFDCAVCSETLEHLPDPEAALSELRRVLTPSGHLLITVPNLFCLDSIEGKLNLFESAGILLHKTGITGKFRHGINTHLQKMWPSKWAEIIRCCGFEIIRDQPVRVFPYVPHFLAPLRALESAILGKPAAIAAQRSIDASASAPLGQLHFFHCIKT